MNKPFLLIAGYSYYPESGTNDWVKCFPTFEEADSFVTKTVEKTGNIRFATERTSYIINERQFDWYNIVDLREWTE